MDNSRPTFQDPSTLEVREVAPRSNGPQGQLSLESQGELQLQALIKSLPSDLKSQVQRAYRQWNLIIRDYMRNETGLRLTVGDDRQGVPVLVVNGLPAPLYHLFVDAPHPIDWFIYANRSVIKAARTGLNMVSESLPPGRWPEQPPDSASDQELLHTVRYLTWLEDRASQVNLRDALQDVNQDVLGAYFYHVPRIELFWLPIGILARFLQVSVEALTLVVLVHEVAHAYTHLGRDIDGTRWDTHQFEKADLAIVEGLAQFYTGVISERLLERYPAASDAYEKLLNVQSAVYWSHYAWFPDWFPKAVPQAGEIVRSAMIICRSKGISDSGAFRSVLQDVERRLLSLSDDAARTENNAEGRKGPG